MTPAQRRRRRLWPLIALACLVLAGTGVEAGHTDLTITAGTLALVAVLCGIADREADHQDTPYEAVDQLPVGREI